jgi:hypothetical protein
LKLSYAAFSISGCYKIVAEKIAIVVVVVEQVRVTREGHNEYFSVLIKAAEDGQSIEEVYRVKVCYF